MTGVDDNFTHAQPQLLRQGKLFALACFTGCAGLSGRWFVFFLIGEDDDRSLVGRGSWLCRNRRQGGCGLARRCVVVRRSGGGCRAAVDVDNDPKGIVEAENFVFGKGGKVEFHPHRVVAGLTCAHLLQQAGLDARRRPVLDRHGALFEINVKAFCRGDGGVVHP